MVATRAERVLEALFQDAVRQRIDDIYGAFVTALAARQTVRYAKQSVDRLVRCHGTERAALPEGRYLPGRFEPGQDHGSAPRGWAWSMPRQRTARPSSTWDRS